MSYFHDKVLVGLTTDDAIPVEICAIFRQLTIKIEGITYIFPLLNPQPQIFQVKRQGRVKYASIISLNILFQKVFFLFDSHHHRQAFLIAIGSLRVSRDPRDRGRVYGSVSKL
ncbi:hypothetical protein WA026_021423 [Henosepilachna vigintioctopunctata]|uniref:Uncharacterized protein n=1 Tax=Henosepilachna vigintioctopunctata TaxID=420089 RepID=A0AAW1TS75_9CUCU